MHAFCEAGTNNVSPVRPYTRTFYASFSSKTKTFQKDLFFNCNVFGCNLVPFLYYFYYMIGGNYFHRTNTRLYIRLGMGVGMGLFYIMYFKINF